MQQMDSCATPMSHPIPHHTNGYHRLHQTIVNPGMRPLGEGGHGSRKRSYPGCLSNGGTPCLKGGSDEFERMTVESWIVPEKSKRVCLEHDRPLVSDATGQGYPTPSQHIHVPPPNSGGHSTIQHEEHMNTSPTKCRRLRPYAVHEYNSCSHFQALSLSVMDCPRCLAGEPGHLSHLSSSQHHSTAMEIN